MNELDALADALRYLRKKKKLKQWEVAERIGISRQQVNAYENRRTRLTVSRLDEFLAALKADKFDLVSALEAAEGRPELRTSRPYQGMAPVREEILAAAGLQDVPEDRADLFLAQLEVLRGWVRAIRATAKPKA